MQQLYENKTNWRSGRIAPAGYTDIPALVKLARRARNGTVNFDWSFSEAQVRSLREAVHEWGHRVTGRYLMFDARVLAAINGALDEPRSVFVLRERSNAPAVEMDVQAEKQGDVVRLFGIAPFDVVVGYGFAGFGVDPSTSARLLPSVSERLRSGIVGLGWDFELLKDEQFRPVVCALYGISPGAGPQPPSSQEPPRKFALEFVGPFTVMPSADLPNLFDHPVSKASGIYVWTMPDTNGDVIRYVGQTSRGFGERISEHLTGMLNGQYAIPDLEAERRGVKQNAWSPDHGSLRWPASLPHFLAQYAELAPKIGLAIRQLRFHFAAVQGDAPSLNDLERTLGHYLKQHTEQSVQLGIAGVRLPGRIPGQRGLVLSVTSQSSIAGLPAEVDG
jgi:hypothetical protein